MENNQESLSTASLHQHGLLLIEQAKFAEAGQVYELIISLEPRNFVALHTLGGICVVSQKFALGINYLSQAIEINPTYPPCFYNLGMAFQGLMNFDKALECYNQAIVLNRNYYEAFNNRGIVLQRLKRDDEALVSFDCAIQINPNIPEIHNNRGNVLKSLKRYEDALKSFDKAIQLNPNYAEAFNNRGVVLKELKRIDETLLSYDRAISLQINYAEAYNNRGIVLSELKRIKEAVADYQQAITLNPNYPEAFNNLGIILKDKKLTEEALNSYSRAIDINPEYSEAFYNRGIILQEMNFLSEAVMNYEKAISINQDYANAHWNLSLTHLLKGNFKEGWSEYEWRWKSDEISMSSGKRNFNEPLWIGEESLRGKRILIYSEQGLGDTLQFCRYVEKVSALGAQVILEVPTALKELMKSLKGVTELVTFGEVLPLFDYQCPMMSLPLAFKTELDTIPANIPYLSCSEEKKTYWKIRLGEHCKLRVGLVWSGGFRPNQPEVWAVNNRRNIPLEKLRVLKNADIEFYSLQKGEPAESELRTLQEQCWDGPEVIDFTSELNDFTDTAGLIENLDLVISVDTSTAHLAGALGKPVWVLNRFDTCWRWLLERDDSPWYPSLKLYRQESIGNWDSVVDKVKTDLFKMK